MTPPPDRDEPRVPSDELNGLLDSIPGDDDIIAALNTIPDDGTTPLINRLNQEDK